MKGRGVIAAGEEAGHRGRAPWVTGGTMSKRGKRSDTKIGQAKNGKKDQKTNINAKLCLRAITIVSKINWVKTKKCCEILHKNKKLAA